MPRRTPPRRGKRAICAACRPVHHLRIGRPRKLFPLARAGFDPAKALALVERGVVRIGMVLADEASAVRKLFERYDNVPASLADHQRPLAAWVIDALDLVG